MGASTPWRLTIQEHTLDTKEDIVNSITMTRPKRPVSPRIKRRAEALGSRLRTARMRRSITASEVAARAGVSRPTLQRLERGSLQVSLAVLARVLEVLGLDDGLDVLATSDELGERLSDARLTRPRRSTKPSLADEL